MNWRRKKVHMQLKLVHTGLAKNTGLEVPRWHAEIIQIWLLNYWDALSRLFISVALKDTLHWVMWLITHSVFTTCQSTTNFRLFCLQFLFKLDHNLIVSSAIYRHKLLTNFCKIHIHIIHNTHIKIKNVA